MMKKKLLYASPLPPMKSGISDYSETLVGGLKEYFDITLLIDDYRLENADLGRNFEVKVYRKDVVDYEDYAHILYNVGNNPYFHSYIYESALRNPGTIILHDYVLYFLTVGHYSNRSNFYSKIYELEGARGIDLLKSCIKKNRDPLACKTVASLLPLNSELIGASRGLLVHSEFTRNMLRERFPNAKVEKIEMVNMGARPSRPDKDYLKKHYGVEDDTIVVCSFGHIEETKLIHIVCQAVNDIARSEAVKICYILVGEGNYVNHYLRGNIIKTGFVTSTVYDSILERCDIVVNLRYPSMGETSISLIHAMGRGKPCLVSDYAWFGELPDDTVIKIDVSHVKRDLLEAMNKLMRDAELRSRYAERAGAYVARNHAVGKIAQDIQRVLEG